MVPEQSVRMLKGRLLPPGDLSAPHPLHPGDQVMTQFQGNPKLAWYPGDANAGLSEPATYKKLVSGGPEQARSVESCLVVHEVWC